MCRTCYVPNRLLFGKAELSGGEPRFNLHPFRVVLKYSIWSGAWEEWRRTLYENLVSCNKLVTLSDEYHRISRFVHDEPAANLILRALSLAGAGPGPSSLCGYKSRETKQAHGT